MILRARVAIAIIFTFTFSLLEAQDTLRIALLNDDSLYFSKSFEDLFIHEISKLQSSRNVLQFDSYYTGQSPEVTADILDLIKSANNTDIILGIGIGSSTYLSQLSDYPIPTISSLIIDRDLLGLEISEEGTSGIHNYSFVETPFDVEKDLNQFYEIHPFKKLAILLDSDVRGLSPFMNAYFSRRVPQESSFNILSMKNDVDEMLNQISEDYDAVYILSASRYSDEGAKEFYHTLSERGISTFALTGRDQVELGAMAGLSSSSFVPNLARRIAIDILKISEGINPSDLEVQLDILSDDFVINMHTLKHLNLYPDFDILNKAILLNLEDYDGEVNWSIKSLIFEALKANLEVNASLRNLSLADQDIRIAKSNLKPQINVNSSATWIDPTRANNSNGQAASISWLTNASLTQLIYSEPAMANVAIQNILKESKEAEVEQIKLDIVLESAKAFLNYLQAKSNVRIQNRNVDVTNRNLDISISKESLGYSGISDVYRLRTQLAQNVITLNTAVSNLSQAQVNINRIINRDQRQAFSVEDVIQKDMISIASEETIARLVKNQRDFDRLADFFVERAFLKLPALLQFDASIRLQERSLLSNERSLFLPKILLQGTVDQPIQYYGVTTPVGFPVLSKKPQLGIGAQISLPIFEGGFRKANIQRDKIAIDQLSIQRKDFQNSLEANLRSNMFILSASYQKVALTQEAALYSSRNFELIEDLYRQGQSDIIRLIDAQNASLTAELNANNALYQLMSDFLTVERSTGEFFFLMSEDEKAQFILDITNSILQK